MHVMLMRELVLGSDHYTFKKCALGEKVKVIYLFKKLNFKRDYPVQRLAWI